MYFGNDIDDCVERGRYMNSLGTIVRFIDSALLLMIVGFLVPGFAVMNIGSALMAAVVIALLGWGIEVLFGRRALPYGRGIAGFISSAAVLYVIQLLVPGMRVSILGMLLASLVIGFADLFVPTGSKA